VRPTIVLVGLAIGAADLDAQRLPPADTVAAFVARTHAATDRYRDRTVAVANGYRRIGPDFPSMGEHWLNVPLLVRGEVDPDRPPILEYVTVDGRPVLAGVAWALLAPNGPPVTPIPAPPGAWHFHAGTVDEESFILGHANHATSDSLGARIAVLHAWIWLDNPAGLFATDNWALPWIRLGLAPPTNQEESPSATTLAAALAAGGESYFTTLLELRHGLSPADKDGVERILGRYARDLRTRISNGAGPGSGAPLVEAWSALEKELRAACPACELTLAKGK
jgi:hypothetical protein